MSRFMTGFTTTKPFTLLFLSLLITACKPTGDFTALHQATGSTEGTTLTWEIAKAGSAPITSVSITPDVGDVTFAGSTDVMPTETTIYTLTAIAHNENGTEYVTTLEVTVYVNFPIADIPFTDPILRDCMSRYNKDFAHEITTVACGGLIDPYNNVTSLEGMEYLSNTESVSIYFSSVEDLAPIGYLPFLSSITLFDSNIVSVAPLTILPNLKKLSVTNSSLVSITPLLELAPQLDSVFLIQNIVPCAQMILLQAQMPEGATFSYTQVTGSVFTSCFN